MKSPKMLMFSIVLTFVSFLAHAESYTFDSKTVHNVSIENSSGNITLRGVFKAQATVEVVKKNFSSDCQLTVNQENNTLKVRVFTEALKLSDECEADLAVSVAPTAKAQVVAGAGKVVVSGMASDLNYAIGSGSLSVAASQLGQVIGTSGSGNVTLNGGVANANLKAGSGDLLISYAKRPLKGEISISSGSGDARVLVPAGTKLKTEFFAGSGSLKNTLGEDRSAEFKVSMKAGAGNLSIEKL